MGLVKRKQRILSKVIIGVVSVFSLTMLMSALTRADTNKPNEEASSSDVDTKVCQQYLMNDEIGEIPSHCSSYLNGYLQGILRSSNLIQLSEADKFANRAFNTRIGSRALFEKKNEGAGMTNKVCLPTSLASEELFATIRTNYQAADDGSISVEQIIYKSLEKNYPC